MKLEVRLFAGLKCHNRELPCFNQNSFELDVPESTTIQQLHQILELNVNYPLINMINGLTKEEDTPLSSGDRIGIFPPVGGG